MLSDRTLGQEHLEGSPASRPAAERQEKRSFTNAWPENRAAVARAAQCAVHGCCCDEEDSAEEPERWDGMA